MQHCVQFRFGQCAAWDVSKHLLAQGLQTHGLIQQHVPSPSRRCSALAYYVVQGAIADLNAVITLEPPGRNLAYAQELAALENRAHIANLQTQLAAEQQRHDSRATYGSLIIEEVGDEPEEAQQVSTQHALAHEHAHAHTHAHTCTCRHHIGLRGVHWVMVLHV